jgi:small nuclear ribonucleoprotein F
VIETNGECLSLCKCVLSGALVSVDQYMNVQLGNAVEYIDEQNKGPLGEILIRCNNILYISGLDEADEDDNAMAQ